VVKAAFEEILREINIKVLSYVNCAKPKVVKIEEVDEYKVLRDSMVTWLKETLDYCKKDVTDVVNKQNNQDSNLDVYDVEMIVAENRKEELSSSGKTNLMYQLRDSVDYCNPVKYFESYFDID
jgi:ERCC4-related helicase